MVVGNALVTSLGFEDSAWKYFVYIFPANLGTRYRISRHLVYDFSHIRSCR